MNRTLKIYLAQINPTVGDLAGNTERMLEVLRREGMQADLIVFPELSLTGYYPQDLLDIPAFVEAQGAYLERLREATRGLRAQVAVGLVERNRGRTGNPLFNTLVLFDNGERAFSYHKKLLPTYSIFDERRHFEPGTASGFHLVRGVPVGFAICEDIWNLPAADGRYRYGTQTDPVEQLIADGARLFVSLNASPSHDGKQAERWALFRRFQTAGLPLVYVNQVGGNDEIQYDGHSLALDAQGQAVLQLAGFAEDGGYVVASYDGDRVELTAATEASTTGSRILVGPALHQAHIVQGLRDYAAKCGFQQVVVGSSGGIDSALTLALAVQALGPENVAAVTMPSRHSSSGSVDDSVVLCHNLGVKLYHHSIEAEYRLATEQFEQAFGQSPSRLTCENIQARIRGRILMEFSNHFGHLLLTTGNKSESAVGYATLYGDMCGGLNLIGDLYKTEVYALSEYLNQQAGRELIPRSIIDKAPSAELADGQKDEDSLPPYPVLDALLKLLIEAPFLSPEEQEVCRQQAESATPEVRQKVAQLVKAAEFKRRQAAPIIRIHRMAFGIGRRIPLAQKYVSTTVTQDV